LPYIYDEYSTDTSTGTWMPTVDTRLSPGELDEILGEILPEAITTGSENNMRVKSIYGMEVSDVEFACRVVAELQSYFKQHFKRVVVHGEENFHNQTCYIYSRVSRIPTRIKRMEHIDLHVVSKPESVQFDINTIPHEGDKIFSLAGRKVGAWFEKEQTLFLTDITHCNNTFAREVFQNIFLALSGGSIPDLLNQIESSDNLFIQTKGGAYQIKLMGKTPSDIDVFKEELKTKAEQILKRAQENYDKSVKSLQDMFEKKQRESVLMPDISKVDALGEGVRIYKQDKYIVYILPMNLNITKVSSHGGVFEIPKKHQIHEKSLLRILTSGERISKLVVLNLDGSTAGVPHHQGGSSDSSNTCLGSAVEKLRINVKDMSDIYKVRAIFEELMETMNFESLGSPTGRFDKLVSICHKLEYDEKLKKEESVWMT